MKPAFAAVQSIFQLFDEDVEPVPDALFSFDCERKPSNATPPACPASAHATPPQAGMHCNLKNTTHLGGAAKAKDAAECQSMCCGTPRCSCWAFSTGGRNVGCWLQDSPVPLQPTSDKNVCGGKVTPHTGPSSGHAVEGFEPVGHAFRNRSAAPDGITHVVVWDASPGCNGALSIGNPIELMVSSSLQSSWIVPYGDIMNGQGDYSYAMCVTYGEIADTEVR